MMSFLDVIHFRSCFLPLFILTMIVLSGYDPTLDLIGSIAGHIYYYFDEVVPRLPETRGCKFLRAPRMLSKLCELLSLDEVRQNFMDGAFGDDLGEWIDENGNI